MPTDARAAKITTARTSDKLQAAVNENAQKIMAGGPTNYANGGAYQLRNWFQHERERVGRREEKAKTKSESQVLIDEWQEVYQSVEAALKGKRYMEDFQEKIKGLPARLLAKMTKDVPYKLSKLACQIYKLTGKWISSSQVDYMLSSKSAGNWERTYAGLKVNSQASFNFPKAKIFLKQGAASRRASRNASARSRGAGELGEN